MKVEKIHACTGHNAALYALAQGRTDRHFLSAGGDGWVVEWDLDDPEMGKLVASVETQCFSLCALRAQNRVVAGNMNGGLHWIDRQSPDLTRNVQHHKKGVYALESIKQWLFSAGGDGYLTRWDAANARTLESLQLSHQALRAIAFSEKRSEIAVGASDESIYFLDAETLAVKRVLKNAHTHSVFTIAYSPDGKCLVSGGRDAMLRVWNLENDYALLSEQPAHWYTINHLVFSPDGLLFATASRDRTIKIWDAQTFELLKVLDTLRFGGHTRSVNRLLWLPDCLVSCGDDRLAIIWKVTAQ
ncbi:MAG: WD40 repeat domain-containing protein [Phycisphaerae bacterium]|nr:WD40 repeat domain-containing protein [Saprospiraceae bacterium]